MATIKQIAHALEATSGNVSEAARALGISRQAVHARIQHNDTLRQHLQDIREELVDIAESGLRMEISKGNIAAIIFTLKASPEAKRRGWSEQQEIEHSGEVTVKVVYTQNRNGGTTDAP